MKVRCRRRCSLLAPKENQKGRRCPEGMKAPVGLLSRRPVCEANAACSARQGRSDFDVLHLGGVCSLLPHKREPERTAVPAGHESPRGAFKPQTGLRSKCRVFSAARARRFRCAAAGRGLFSFDTKREPERTAVPGGHESPSGAFKPQTGLRSKCRVFSAARARRFRRAGPTRKRLLAPFNPKEDGLHTKKLAASLRRVAAPCVCFVPWAALASCRPLPQQLLPVSAAGGGRRRCTFFLASPIDRPLSRCGGSSPQGASGCSCRLPSRPLPVKKRI